MGYYNSKVKEASLKYMKEKQKRVPLSWKRTDWEERVKPYIDQSGEPVSTFIKKAVENRMRTEQLNKDDKEILE